MARMLRVQSDVESSLAEAIRRDDDFALAHVMTATLGYDSGADVDIAYHVQRAREAVARRGTSRERGLVECLTKRIRGEGDARNLISYLGQYPQCACALHRRPLPRISRSAARTAAAVRDHRRQ